MGAGLLVAAATGVFIAVQVSVLGRSAASFDPLVVSFVVQAAGLVTGLVYVTSRGRWPDVAAVAGRWWWIPLGVLGWGLVGALGFAASRAGAAAALAVSIAVQVSAAWILDRR